MKSLKELKEELKNLYSTERKLSHALDLAQKLAYDLEEEYQNLPDEYDLKDDIKYHPANQKFRRIKNGKITVYKKLSGGGIATLEIPAKAQRSQDIYDDMKCRASEAKVLKIENRYGKSLKSGKSKHDNSFIYHVGKTVKPRDAFDTTGTACASGIHFFMTREDAENY